MVAISQSGESTDTNLVLERAREQGAMTIGITNETRSTLAQAGRAVFLVRAGREKSVAATKTYTGQMLVFYLLALRAGRAISPRRSATAARAVARPRSARAGDRRFPSDIASWITRWWWAAD